VRLSRRRVVLASAGFLSTHVAHAGPSARDLALELITQLRLGASLSQIALAMASRTQTFPMLASRFGADQARIVVQRELDTCLPRYQSVWNQHLAATCAKHVSVEELQSLGIAGRNSKFARKVAQWQTSIGIDPGAASEPVLNALVADAMRSALDKTAR